MSIQRYELEYEDDGCRIECLGIEEDEDGDYVLYTAHVAEVERLTVERDVWIQNFETLNEKLEMVESERDTAVLERDAAVEIIRDALSGFMLTQKGAQYPEWHWSVRARAALAKIEGGRG